MNKLQQALNTRTNRALLPTSNLPSTFQYQPPAQGSTSLTNQPSRRLPTRTHTFHLPRTAPGLGQGLALVPRSVSAGNPAEYVASHLAPSRHPSPLSASSHAPGDENLCNAGGDEAAGVVASGEAGEVLGDPAGAEKLAVNGYATAEAQNGSLATEGGATATAAAATAVEGGKMWVSSSSPQLMVQIPGDLPLGGPGG